MKIQKRRFKLLQQVLSDIKESDAPGTTYEFPPSSRKHIAACLVNIDGYLADRLASIEEIEHSGVSGHLAHFFHWVDQSTICWDVGQGYELGPIVYSGL